MVRASLCVEGKISGLCSRNCGQFLPPCSIITIRNSTTWFTVSFHEVTHPQATIVSPRTIDLGSKTDVLNAGHLPKELRNCPVVVFSSHTQVTKVSCAGLWMLEAPPMILSLRTLILGYWFSNSDPAIIASSKNMSMQVLYLWSWTTGQALQDDFAAGSGRRIMDHYWLDCSCLPSHPFSKPATYKTQI